MRVWDRTCPACNPEAEALVDELREQLAAAEQRATAAERERDEAIRGLDNCIKDRHKMMQKRATLEAERPEMLGRLETAERENAALKHDIERHVGIAAAEATRAEAAESASAAMRHQMELIELETRDNGQWTLAEVNEVAADALRALAGKEAT
jgi:chromosome segregation ATPase